MSPHPSPPLEPRAPRAEPLFDRRGSVAVETAIMVPVIIFILYAAVDIGRYMLVRADVQRAAASLAETVVDEPPIDPERPVPDDVPSAVYNAVLASRPHWPGLVDMMVDNDGDTAGIGVDAVWYYHSSEPPLPPLRLPVTGTLQAGATCPTSSGGTAFDAELATASMATSRNIARPVYLMVRVCYRYALGLPGLSAFVLPEWIESSFVAARKDRRR